MSVAIFESITSIFIKRTHCLAFRIRVDQQGQAIRAKFGSILIEVGHRDDGTRTLSQIRLHAIVLVFQFQDVPVAFRQSHFRCPTRDDIQVTTQHECLFFCTESRVLGIKHESRAHHRHTVHARFFEQGIDVRHQAITAVDGRTTNVQGLLVECPRFLSHTVFGSMISHKREIHAKGCPMSQEVGMSTADKTTDIRTIEWLTTQAQCQTHRHTGLKLFPSTLVVACPCSGIAMSTQEITTTQHERTLVRISQQKAVTACTNHVITIYIMETQVRTFGHAFPTPMDVVFRHGYFRAITDSRFIHVVPNTVNTMSHERNV